jgi:rhodanese-related sulfurtransferase
MILRIVAVVLGLFLLSAISISGVSAHHSYLLTVQQLRAGLTKAPSMPQKGFILIDVRSAEEHATGFIPGTDLNIEFREIQARHREIGANWRTIWWSIVSPGIAAILRQKRSPIWATVMSITSPAA